MNNQAYFIMHLNHILKLISFTQHVKVTYLFTCIRLRAHKVLPWKRERRDIFDQGSKVSNAD